MCVTSFTSDSALPGTRTWGWTRCSQACVSDDGLLSLAVLVVHTLSSHCFDVAPNKTKSLGDAACHYILSLFVSPILTSATFSSYFLSQLCHPGNMRVASLSYDPISANFPVTFHNNIARWSTFVTHVPMSDSDWQKQCTAFKLSQLVQIALNLMIHGQWRLECWLTVGAKYKRLYFSTQCCWNTDGQVAHVKEIPS